MIYYLIILVLFICSLLNQVNLKKVNFDFLGVFCFILFLFFGGFRYKVGADWGGYQMIFEQTNSFSDLFKVFQEKFFMIFLYVCKNIFNSYSFFIFSFFVVSFYIKYRFFQKFSSDVFLSLIIYFYTIFLIYDINGIRQGMAISIVFLSIKPILDRKLLPFLIVITIATLFHTSALIVIPFYWLSQLRLSTKTILIVTLIVFVISIPIRYALENSTLMQYMLTLEKFSHYTYYIDNDEAGRSLPILSIAVLQRLFVLFLFLYNFNRIEVDEDFKFLLLNAYFVSIVIFIFLSFNAEFSARLSFYYKSFEIIIIPLIVSSQVNKKYAISLLTIFLMLCLFGTYRILEIPNGGLIPYQSLLW